MINSLRNLAAALVTGSIAFTFLLLWMHASAVAALAFSATLGVLVLAISGPGNPIRDRQADEAWEKAAPDLPPYSERRAMERDQDAIEAPAPSPAMSAEIKPSAPVTASLHGHSAADGAAPEHTGSTPTSLVAPTEAGLDE